MSYEPAGAPGALAVQMRSVSNSGLVGPAFSGVFRSLAPLAPAEERAGVLAMHLHLAPGGVTHHVKSLEAADLIRRTRHGSSHVRRALGARHGVGSALRISARARRTFPDSSKRLSAASQTADAACARRPMT